MPARQQLPPLKMTLAPIKAPIDQKRKALYRAGSITPPTKKPIAPLLVRRSSSMQRILTHIVDQVEMRYRSLREAFRFADRDGSGALTPDELKAALFFWRVQAQGRHIEEIVANLDRDCDGVISFGEFCEGLKPYAVQSQPVFGLSDAHVTDRHRVIGGTARVLINDNLSPLQRNTARADYELFELPHSAVPASPEVLKRHTTDLSNRIHNKYTKLKDAFRAFDEDKDGRLSKQELLMAVRCFNLPIPKEHVIQIAQLCDADADGQINYAEFAKVLKRKDALGN